MPEKYFLSLDREDIIGLKRAAIDKEDELLSLQEENRKLKAENARLKKPVKKSNKH